MVGVINPNSTQNITYQERIALRASYSLSPGQAFPAESAPSGLPSNTLKPSAAASSVSGKSLSGGAIAGVVVAVLVFVALLAVIFYLFGRNRVHIAWQRSDLLNRSDRLSRTTAWTQNQSHQDGFGSKAPYTPVGYDGFGSPPPRFTPKAYEYPEPYPGFFSSGTNFVDDEPKMSATVGAQELFQPQELSGQGMVELDTVRASRLPQAHTKR